jgi:hypothetical protein
LQNENKSYDLCRHSSTFASFENNFVSNDVRLNPSLLQEQLCRFDAPLPTRTTRLNNNVHFLFGLEHNVGFAFIENLNGFMWSYLQSVSRKTVKCWDVVLVSSMSSKALTACCVGPVKTRRHTIMKKAKGRGEVSLVNFDNQLPHNVDLTNLGHDVIQEWLRGELGKEFE